MHTDHHTIRCHLDNNVNFDRYRTRNSALCAQAMQDGIKLTAATKFVLVAILAIIGTAVIAATVSLNAATNCSRCESADTRAVAPLADRGGARIFVHWPAASVRALRERIAVLESADPQRWWEGYGKTPSRSQVEAIAELRMQIAKRRAASSAAHAAVAWSSATPPAN